MSLESRLSALIAAIGADIKALQSAGGGGGGGSLYLVPSNIAHSTPATTAANIEANTNSTDIWTISVPAGQRLRVDALIMTNTAATATGVAIGCNMTTASSGAVDAVLDVDITAPVTHAQATSAVHRVSRVERTTTNATTGVAVLNTAATTTVAGMRVKASLVNRGANAVTFRLKFGTEVNSSAITVQADSSVDYQLYPL